MIVDKLCNLELYSSVVPEFTAVADFLRNNDIASFEEGSYEIVPGVKLNISEYEPYAIGDKWEVHRRYADLQMVLCGDEKMDCKSTLECVGGEYNEEDDYMFMDSDSEDITNIYMTPGHFAYFAPHDAHRPGLKWTGAKVKKAVVKIPYNK
ncbi:MAG: YhcH/YjgK/YiaL family protein [Clostridia bacterium]|nr:YhcH/YjgK/YiaL family protein [Clostridia bacterium]